VTTNHLTRQERIKFACAASTGLISGIARAVISWLLDQRS